MSAASTTPTLTTLPERAFALHCAGLRSPTIAQQLGVPERTVRHWIARLRDEIAAENTALLRDEFIRAVEHLHQLSAAAWAAFEDEQAAAHPPTTDPSTAPQISIPRHGPRYLRLSLDAQRHLSRLFGHFDHLRAALLDPTSAPDPSLAPTLASPPAAHTETAIPAKTAMPSIGAIEIPAKTATDVTANLRIPAESATASDSPLLAEERARPQPLSGGQSLGERPTVSGVRSQIPAKTASAGDRLAVGFGMPANPRSPIPSPSFAQAHHRAPFSAQAEGPGVRSHSPAKTATSPFPASVPLHWRM